VFLINLIPLHVLALMVTGRFSHRIYVAYSTVSLWLLSNCSVVARQFYYRASAVAASPVLATIGMSVRLSVRPSVTP